MEYLFLETRPKVICMSVFCRVAEVFVAELAVGQPLQVRMLHNSFNYTKQQKQFKIIKEGIYSWKLDLK
jgi:hypothetical protein